MQPRPQATVKERERGEGAKLSSCLMPKLMHDVAALARLSYPLCVCLCVCSTCCCAHFNYEPDYNVSWPVSGEGARGKPAVAAAWACLCICGRA